MPLLFDRGMECLVVKYKTFSNQDCAQFHICLFVHHLFVRSITKRILCDTLLKSMQQYQGWFGSTLFNQVPRLRTHSKPQKFIHCKYSQLCIALNTVLLTLHDCALISHVKLSPKWALIQVNFNPIQEIGPKVGIATLVLLDYSMGFESGVLRAVSLSWKVCSGQEACQLSVCGSLLTILFSLIRTYSVNSITSQDSKIFRCPKLLLRAPCVAI